MSEPMSEPMTEPRTEPPGRRQPGGMNAPGSFPTRSRRPSESLTALSVSRDLHGSYWFAVGRTGSRTLIVRGVEQHLCEQFHHFDLLLPG
jgi:hypothetical protein